MDLSVQKTNDLKKRHVDAEKKAMEYEVLVEGLENSRMFYFHKYNGE